VRELKSEKSGIFNWMVGGLHDLIKRGSFNYSNPYLELYKEESSSLYSWWVDEGELWLNDPCEFHNSKGKALSYADVVYNDEKHVYFSAFFDHYDRYCYKGGMRASGRNKLRSECERLQMPIVFYTGNYNARVVRLDVNHFVNASKVVNTKESINPHSEIDFNEKTDKPF
jgi:phage/plasmid-associated DNA primase